MSDTIQLKLPPDVAFDEAALRAHLADRWGADARWRVVRRSVDARRKPVMVNLTVCRFAESPPPLLAWSKEQLPDVADAPPAVVVGAGPAGLFAALRLIARGIRPIVIERGGDVRARRRDLAALSKQHVVNPESNYCFGEGGAGTYSDGKLYTRSKKRGDIRHVLEVLVDHGATPDILVDAHPHIGTNKLPKVVAALRETVLAAGGQVLFNTKVTDLIIAGGALRGVVTHDGTRIEGLGVLLATGHSARDVFELLYRRDVLIEAKPFALGVRVEHPQGLIDWVQYHGQARGQHLPAAAYSLVQQVDYQGQRKGVFSFCMCPGGFVVPAATAPGEVVVNGMSPSRRNSRFANSGIVVAVDESDWKPFAAAGPLAGVAYQRAVEQRACAVAGGTQAAPAQRLADFVKRRVSETLPDVSYQPGLTSASLYDVLPTAVAERLRVAFRLFGQRMRGYLTNDAQLIGVESRTSSPVRIPRDPATLEHPTLRRLFPCGEGAGYAGGIVSAAMDGQRCADQLADLYFKETAPVGARNPV